MMIDRKLKRDSTYPHSGRLIVLDQKTDLTNPTAALENHLSIDFPAMPDVIELSRTAEYEVSHSMSVPDGVHQYMGTKPLEIPISFPLHYNDPEYCAAEGAKTILTLAARLHSFVAPIGNNDTHVNVGREGEESGQEGAQKQKVDEGESGSRIFLRNKAEIEQELSPPVSLLLELMWTEDGGPGIACVGYLKDVNTKFHGPFMRGPGGAYNLPSRCEYSFTFVHRPGHGNSFRVNTTLTGQQPQAYARKIKDNFYNTRDLTAQSGAGFRGFLDD